MKKIFNSMAKSLTAQEGFILPMALMFLAIGALLVVPILDLVSTSLQTGLMIEQRTIGAYAAEAGINDAVWKFKNNQGPFAAGNTYTLTINGMTVTVNKYREEPATQGGTLYTLISAATLNSQTQATIHTQLLDSSSIDLTYIMDNAIISPGNVTIKPGVVIDGDVAYNGTLDNKGTINGTINGSTHINWPETASLKAFYWDKVKNLTPLPGGTTITISGTQGNPTVINSTLVNGNLFLNGTGYAKLADTAGTTIYVKGNLDIDRCTLNLNNKTFFVEGTIYFHPGSTLSGSGCIISIGDITFKPNLSASLKLIGVNPDDSPSSSAVANTFLLTRFTASASGKMTTFKVRCSGTGNIKVALYADGSGSPGALLAANDISQAVYPGWNDITIPAHDLVSGTAYWLAAIADSSVIGRQNVSSTNKYIGSTFSTFTFPNPAGSGFPSTTTNQHLFAGYKADYILVMSLEHKSEIYPNGSFYGTIAGDAEVYVSPGCTLSWTEPGATLNIPTVSGGGGGGGSSSGWQVLNYTIQ